MIMQLNDFDEVRIEMKYYYPREYKALLKLGIPITIGQIGMTLQNLADNMMVGQHSTQELAAAGLINNLFILALLLTVGFSIGAVPVIGSLYAQHRKREIASTLKSSIVADTLQGMAVLLALVVLYFCLPYMGQPVELVPLMKPYLLIQIASLPFAFLFNPFRQCTDSINDTSVSMIITLLGNALNIFLNWVLIYGNLGCPELGIIGAGWATFSSRVLMCLLAVAVFFFRPKYREYVQYWKKSSWSKQELFKLNKLGWPIAIQMGMEVASFSIVAIFAGWLGTNDLAAHQVMLAVSNIVFMAFMGISTAVSIRVSNHMGLNNRLGIRHATLAGWQIAIFVSAVLSSVVFLFRHEVSLLFTDNEEVAKIVAVCVYALILYQLGDGMQCTYLNALRGIGDVKKLMQYSFVAYIVISMPLSYFFSIPLGWGTFGIWMGFPFGLTVAGILYMRRFLRLTKSLPQE